MSQEQIQAVEKNIKEAKAVVELASALERLRTNRDFRKVVTEGYFKEEAVRLVQLKADPNMQHPDVQRAILRDIDAIGSLNQYFEAIFTTSRMAAKAIAADEETLVELRQEAV